MGVQLSVKLLPNWVTALLSASNIVRTPPAVLHPALQSAPVGGQAAVQLRECQSVPTYQAVALNCLMPSLGQLSLKERQRRSKGVTNTRKSTYCIQFNVQIQLTVDSLEYSLS